MFSRTWVGDRLRAEGLITTAQLAAALRMMDQHEERLEESLLRVGAITEKRLLQYLAGCTHTQYISSAKLARLEVPLDTLRKVPERLAKRLQCVPIHFDHGANRLLVAAPDAGMPEYVKELGIATRFRAVRACIARPAAVEAAIRKWYRGEKGAFAGIIPDAFAELGSSDARADEPARRANLSSGIHVGRGAGRHATACRNGPDQRELDLGEMLQVLVGLIESGRGELRGHSSHVARMMCDLAALLGLDESGALYFAIAGNLHDVGKPTDPHLTLLSVNQYQPHRISAQQLVRTPLSWLANVQLPVPSIDAVASIYERFDGRGFPVGLRGDEIPLAARVLSACDTFADLTANPCNPYRRTLTEVEAYDVIAQFEGSLFDPYVVLHLAQLIGITGAVSSNAISG